MKILSSVVASALLLLLLVVVAPSSVRSAQAQQQPFVFPNDDGVDYDACLQELARADANQDDELNLDEYEDFVRAYQERILASCATSTSITTQQEQGGDVPFTFTATHGEAFRSLACMCRCQDGYDCCTGDKAHVDTHGSVDQQRTWRQHYYLSTVCQVTDGSITVPRCSDLVAPTTTSSLESGGSLRGQSASSVEEDEDKSSCAVYGALILGGLAALVGLTVFFKKKRAKARAAAATVATTPKTLDDATTAADDDESTVAASVEDNNNNNNSKA